MTSATGMRALYLVTVLWGMAIPWFAAHPPMIDLPQHAGQLALLKQLLQGESHWAYLLQLNLFTPYLIGFGLALPLTFLMPVAAAMKLLLSLAYLAFVIACVALRKRLGADARLDWLCVVSFFGLAYKWGFFTFLLAAPLGLGFILLAESFARVNSLPRGLAVVATGLLLLVSHGLVFLFACLVAVALLASCSGGIRRWLVTLWPFVALGLACLGYFFARGQAEAVYQIAPTIPAVSWAQGLRHEILYYSFGNAWTQVFVVACVTMLATPWLLGLRIDRKRVASWVPLAMVVLVLILVPSFMLETSVVYQRFALFLFPAYAWAFGGTPVMLGEGRSGRKLIRTLALPLVMAACWSVLWVHSVRAWQFGKEAAEFDLIAAQLEPGKRGLAMVFDRSSAADGNWGVYTHYATWYQAEMGGLVDFNFAWVQPQIVRYRPDVRPPVRLDFPWRPQAFDWHKHQGGNYRYFFVRHSEPLPANLFRGADCAPILLHQRGSWKVFERRQCPP